MLTLVLVFVITVAVAYFIRSRLNANRLRDQLGLKGPAPNFFFGNFKQLNDDRLALGPNATVYDTLGVYRKKYGETFGYYLGNRLEICTFDLELLRDVFIKNFSLFTNRPFVAASSNQEVTNRSLINLTSKEWKDVRSLISPVFTTGKLKQMCRVIGEKLDILVKRFDELAESGEKDDIYPYFQGMTLDVIGKIAFAIDTNCQTDKNDPFLLNCQEFFQNLDITKQPLIFASFLMPELEFILGPLRKFLDPQPAETWLLGVLRKVINQRLQKLADFKDVDILQLLLMQGSAIDKQQYDSAQVTNRFKKDLELDENTILANTFVFLLAGYETTSTALGYTAWCLANHPDTQRKLQEEVDDKLAGKEELSFTEVHEMVYLDAVFKESLRKYPPVPLFVSRACSQDCELQGQKLAKGVQVIAPVYNIHHDPDLWENPEEYRPERFIEDVERHPMAWLPFGVGPRNCVGLRFAEMEYKMALVKVMRNFSFVLPDDAPKELVVDSLSPVMRPCQGIWLKVEKR